LLAAMVLPAAKGTAKIPAARVAGVRQEANPAVTAPHRAVPQIRTIAQDAIQQQLILTKKRKTPFVLMPIVAKREEFRDGYNKTARFSVKMLIVLCISSCYSLDAKASRGRARSFLCARAEKPRAAPHDAHPSQTHPRQSNAVRLAQLSRSA
jgi:hypothetical protein